MQTRQVASICCSRHHQHLLIVVDCLWFLCSGNLSVYWYLQLVAGISLCFFYSRKVINAAWMTLLHTTLCRTDLGTGPHLCWAVCLKSEWLVPWKCAKNVKLYCVIWLPQMDIHMSFWNLATARTALITVLNSFRQSSRTAFFKPSKLCSSTIRTLKNAQLLGSHLGTWIGALKKRTCLGKSGRMVTLLDIGISMCSWNVCLCDSHKQEWELGSSWGATVGDSDQEI